MIINSENIKKKAIDLGIHKVGIAKASQTKKEEEQLNQWINNKKYEVGKIRACPMDQNLHF